MVRTLTSKNHRHWRGSHEPAPAAWLSHQLQQLHAQAVLPDSTTSALHSILNTRTKLLLSKYRLDHMLPLSITIRKFLISLRGKWENLWYFSSSSYSLNLLLSFPLFYSHWSSGLSSVLLSIQSSQWVLLFSRLEWSFPTRSYFSPPHCSQFFSKKCLLNQAILTISFHTSTQELAFQIPIAWFIYLHCTFHIWYIPCFPNLHVYCMCLRRQL